jgi:hypothetical protein
MVPQWAISSMVLVHPLHSPVLVSIMQTEIQGEGTEGLGVVGLVEVCVGFDELFKSLPTVVDVSTEPCPRAKNWGGPAVR